MKKIIDCHWRLSTKRESLAANTLVIRRLVPAVCISMMMIAIIAKGQDSSTAKSDSIEAGAQIQESSTFESEKPPSKFPVDRPNPVVRRLSAELGKALAEPIEFRRKRLLKNITKRLAEEAQSGHPIETRFEIMRLQIQMFLRLGRSSPVESAIEEMHRLAIEQFSGNEMYGEWATAEANRWRAHGEYSVAISLLDRVAATKPSSELAARSLLLAADIAFQRNFTNGPYAEAISRYRTVYEQYQKQYSDLAQDARLRQAKALWRHGDRLGAKKISEDLIESKIESIADAARHLEYSFEVRTSPITATSAIEKLDEVGEASGIRSDSNE